ncbi:hypothetical protein [Paenibacillus rhizophilus]|uniref:Uncharacterized protein n=1 Tax=Paenibacillus rhizophilus TaxID=1850366 RepID=A0A3N9PY68_9BACL|nr:hypothetical protein [Paenibacillus rhizophilus]RQW10136.1 hypothetical protein EH198_17070 [Paenibacillus rhizophilus]
MFEIFRKKLVMVYKSPKKMLVSVSASALLFSLLLALICVKSVLIYKPNIKNFSDHIMSSATAANLDIAGRINTYIIFLTGLILIAAFFFLVIYRMVINRCNDSTLPFIRLITDLSFIGIVGVVTSILSAGQDLALFFIGEVILLGWIYIRFFYDRNIELSMFVWYIFMAIPLSLFVWVVSKKLHLLDRLLIINLVKNLELNIDVLYVMLVCFISSTILLFVCEKLFKHVRDKTNIEDERLKNIMFIAGIPVMLTGILQPIMLEVLNIFNKRFGIITNRSLLMYCILFAICLILFMIIFFFFRNDEKWLNIDRKKLLYKIYIPIILASVAFMIAQPSRVAGVGKEYFEMANHGLAIDQFFKYGSIPIIENYDAHMLYNQVFAYLYSFVNGYEPWAAFLYDKYVVVIYILLVYYLLKNLIGEINSFFFIFTFPLLENLFNILYLFSGIIVFFIYRCVKDGSIFNNTKFWLAATFLCIYRLDLGVGAIISGVITYIISCFIYRQRYSKILKFLGSGVIIIFSGIILFVVLCLIKGVSPADRVVEFVKLCQSNQNWAYISVGDYNLIAYTVVYYLLPILILVISLITIGKFTVLQDEALKVNQQNLIMFFYFSFFYLANISRGIVRHSLVEGSITHALGTFSLAILSYMIIRFGYKGKIVIFLITSIITIALININMITLKGSISVTTKAITSTNYYQQYTNSFDFNGSRVRGELSDATQLKDILDATLKKDETYFDFSSTNYFHALVNRKNPIYANQSPLMISDDTTQKLALKEIKLNNPSYVLMPIGGRLGSSIDNISVDFKYYMLSEYIYENYTPFIRLANFDLYVLKSKKDIYHDKLVEKGLFSNVIEDQPEVWVRDIGDIPLLWAERDGNGAFLKASSLIYPIINFYQFSVDTQEKIMEQPLFIILEIESEANQRAAIELNSKNKDKLGEFLFNISKGKHSYAIRLSTDYKWWNNKVDNLSFLFESKVSISKMLYYNDVKGKYYSINPESNLQLKLSNLSDEHWINGIGKDNFTLLFDATFNNLEQLRVGNKLVFKDGRKVTITSVNISGAYIHVLIGQKLDAYSDIASFPNSIGVNE